MLSYQPILLLTGKLLKLLIAIIATGGGEINANKARIYMGTGEGSVHIGRCPLLFECRLCDTELPDKSARSVRQKVQELGLRGEGGSTASPGRQGTSARALVQKLRARDSVGGDSGGTTEHAGSKKEKLMIKRENSPDALSTDGSSWHRSSAEL